MKWSKELNGYEEIWKYIVVFQSLNYAVHALIIKFALKNWLNEKDVIDNLWEEDTLLSILLAEKSVYQLLHNLKSFAVALYWEKSEEYKLINYVCKYIVSDKSKVLSRRNDIIHAFLHVDEISDPNDIYIYRKKIKWNKWYWWISDFDTNIIKKEIEKIEVINLILHGIWRNLDENSKILWEIQVWKDKYTISYETIKDLILKISSTDK
jgi:hypothetical protein